MHAKGKHLLLSFRVANVRKKEMLKPEVNVLIAMEDEGSDPDFEDGVENAGRILRMQVSESIFVTVQDVYWILCSKQNCIWCNKHIGVPGWPVLYPENYFYPLSTKSFLDQSIDKMYYVFLKTEALWAT